ncbi:glucose-6-phosphate dehydrogenase [Antiquaquibacter soli]|uniref:Glucose-6-phosphate dehydrogenase n=1 Tax=Antiquaquibacter soli TaxID=3064523 RepID=A0ABT9BN00_9MICO|nr:glucose-6-phosphate dehydrogenase [Protaetiibacter sp. WY-16]MDO7882411.1 glucose-6-phosphate dehydrogenase [Protaetiibacter sp. WY-16]
MTDRIETLVILGAGGDLTARLLLPGVASFLASSRAQPISIIGVDRDDTTDADWRSTVATAFADSPSALGRKVAKSSRYLRGDATSPEDLKAVLDAATGRIAVYFALPPAVAALAVRALSTIDLPKGIVFALEKPFGTDLKSAQALNRLLETMVPEHQVFRVDHFLGKTSVLNLIGLRFANRIFEPLFSSENISRVEIVVDESLALENRAGYYDRAGALVDMIQSHLLLVLALAAMEPPASLDADDLRGAMAQVLRATRPWRKNGTSSRRARYGAGSIAGRRLPAYIDEDGVDPSLKTETLAEVTLAIDNWRWAGVPFVLRSGKALGENRQDIVVTFKDVPHLPTGLTGIPGPSSLRISLKPATLDLDLVINGEGDPFTLDRSMLHADLGDPELSAYGEVLSELLECDPTIAVRGDVAEQCWRIVAPVLAAWRKDAVPLETYPAGSLGPSSW